jgi:MtN3 and saliva related transmembrane protein
MEPDIIGWLSSAVLLATLVRQVFRQWRERSTEGVSRWLFIGQLAASSGFLVYSYLLANWVFVVTNAALLGTAIAGQMIYQRALREERREQAHSSRDREALALTPGRADADG